MERIWIVVFLTLQLFQYSTTFILSLKKPDGSLDSEHLVGHMTLLEQTVTNLQQTVTTQNLDIASLKTEISNLKANQQTLASQNGNIATIKSEISNLKTDRQTIATQTADISALKTEVLNLKSSQHTIDIKITDLQKQVLTGSVLTGGTTLQNLVNAVSTEVRSVSKEVASLTSKFNNLTQNYQSLSSIVNSTDALRAMQIEDLSQKINDTTATTHFNFKNLKYEFESLLTHVNSTDVNVGRNLKVLQQTYHNLSSQSNSLIAQNIKTLAQIQTDVRNAQNDRVLLQNSITGVNVRLTGLANITTTELYLLSSQIQTQVRPKVGFKARLGPFNANLTGTTTIKFSDIQYNVGGSYNKTSGVFTVPLAGTYLFWTQVRKLTGYELDVLLMKDGVPTGYSHTPTRGKVTGSVVTTAHVQAGATFYVMVGGADSVGCCYASVFGGQLLFAE